MAMECIGVGSITTTTQIVDPDMMKRRPLVGVQACAAADVCCASFPWICMCKAGNTF
jgi:hypothetical protein